MAQIPHVPFIFLFISQLLPISRSCAAEILTIDNETSHSISNDIIKFGCVYTWINQNTNLTVADDANKYDEGYNPESCSRKCLEKNESFQLSFLKGALCECAPISGFESLLDNDENQSSCNVRCPIKENPSMLVMDGKHTDDLPELEFSCGGNERYTVYCTPRPGSSDCNSFKRQAFSEINETTPQLTHGPFKSIPVIENECATCNGTLGKCMGTKLSTTFDYFPLNSPEDCVNFCDTDVWEYVDDSGSNVKQFRDRKAFSVLMWWAEPGSTVLLPMCHCMEQSQREWFTPTSMLCTTKCPGDSSKICGDKQPRQEGVIYGTVYCNEDDLPGKRCHDLGTSTPIISTTFSSTVSISTKPPSEESTVTTTASHTTITTSISTTEESEESSSTPTVTPNPSSTSVPPTTTTVTVIPPIPSCNLSCEAIDRHGYHWKVCNGTLGNIRCSKLSRNATGMAFWSCSKEGHFETSQPDVSNCTTRWLREKTEEVGDVKDIESASRYIEDLSEACGGNFDLPDKTYYFGHEIPNMTKLVNLALRKVRQSWISINYTSWSPSFPSLVESGLTLDTCLIQYQEPWRDLNISSKSSVSTSLIENMEEKLFQLTSMFKDSQNSEQKMQWTFIPDPDDMLSTPFHLMAEIFTGFYQDEGVYDFPSSTDKPSYSPRSHIRLPMQWRNLLTNFNVELAAMSIQSQYIEYIMPVSFGTSATNATLPFERFQLNLRGVEITFEHDIPAWGEKIVEIRRKLHPGERPTAVRSSAQCVFWNMMTNTWSPIGCKLSRTTRHESLCICNHLTSFAVLMDVHKYLGKDPGLELLTLILCAASEIALILTIILLLPVKSGFQRMRATITKNLAFCLFIGNGLVLLVLDRNYFHMGETTCLAAGMVTHYVFLCAFMWMLIEGIQLYRMVECVFNMGRSYTKHFFIFAYVSPTIIVGVTSATGYFLNRRPYGSDVYCWLEGSFTWAFMLPVAIITIVNLSILFIALKAGYRLQGQHNFKRPSPAGLVLMGKMQSYKSWLKGCASLTVTLGLTWSFGFSAGLMTGSSGLVSSYIFTILNASQGIFLLLFTCRVFPENCNLLTARLPTWFTSVGGSSPAEQIMNGKKKGKK